MVLKITNTATGEKEEFKPQGDEVKMYVCGPTVYDDCHIGHARSYVSFDTIRRYLKFKGYHVKYVQNFTDIDDKIINRARENHEDPLALSRRYIERYFEDMHKLNIQDADVHPKCTDHIPEMITIIQGLIDKGFAYASGGSVYFSILKAKDKFGTLCHQDIFDMLDGARVDPDEFKDYPKDFALWKAAKPDEISWDSPWGKGRPGWHIECSAMSMKHLGKTLDVHGGGQDLVFPHHESSILQSECYTGQKFCNMWIHNAFILVNQEKMSKSLKNFFTIREILEKYEPQVIRFFLVYNHYRSPVDFGQEFLEEAKQGYGRLKNMVIDLTGKIAGITVSKPHDLDKELLMELDKFKVEFIAAMDDDFNTRIALSQLFDLARLLNKYVANKDYQNKELLQKAQDTFMEYSGLLGLDYQDPKSGLDVKKIEELISKRKGARDKKDWKESDRIRDELKAMGIQIEDKKEGTIWKNI